MKLALALAAASAAVAFPATACSVAAGYRIPTTLELVREADMVVIAMPRSETVPEDADDRTVEFITSLILKDDGRGGPDAYRPIAVEVFGALAAPDMAATPSDPDEIARANPQAFAGACNRYVFAPDMPVLLFLKHTGADYRAISHPFARTAEDVADIRGRWARAVREYIAIAALPREMQRSRLEARSVALGRKRDADSRAIAADMVRELNAPRKPLREPLPPVPDGMREGEPAGE